MSTILPAKGGPSKSLTLTGQFVRLVPLDANAHCEELFKGSHGGSRESVEQHWRYLPDGPFESVELFREHLRQFEVHSARVTFAVQDIRTERIVGTLTYLNIEPAHGSIEIGYIWYAPEVKRTYCNTECCYLLIKYAFEELGFRRVEWKCNARNAPSVSAAIRLGFSFEGIFRQHMIVKGQSRDSAWFSIIDKEWPEKKAALEQKLYGDYYQKNKS